MTPITRRSLLQSAALLPVVAPTVRLTRPSDKLRLACVGVWNRGRANLSAVTVEQVVALCDVDSGHLANAEALVKEAGGAPRTYRDFRELLAQEDDLDGVVVSTPDHTHASVAIAAMQRDLPVYCEKPLAHSVDEVRRMQALAREKGLATQMGTQIHAGDNYRRVVEAIRAGAIGRVESVDVWCGKSWSGGRFQSASSVPERLDWDLWQGPVPARSYSEGLHPANWRRFWSYGTGTLGDMGCHYLDLAHWALDLGPPEHIVARGPEGHPDGTPAWIEVVWARNLGSANEVRVSWSDGKQAQEHASAREAAQAKMTGGGLCFRGERGYLVSDYGRHEVHLSEGTWEPPEATIAASVGHHREWLDAIRNGTSTTCSFDYSGNLTSSVLLGNVAFRDPSSSGLFWDDEGAVAYRDAALTERSTEADPLLRPSARDGWGL